MNISWHSYPKVYNLGHKYLEELFLDPVICEEKVDGSQFSFGRFDGELKCRSKGAQLNVIAPEKMFLKAVEMARILDLHEGWTYRAEYLTKPKHNSLAYDRTPSCGLIIFDINVGEEDYLPYLEKAQEADRLGLEVVPILKEGMIEDIAHFRQLLDTTSVLGGQKVEGIVIKNYSRFGLDKKALMGKFVSESFREVHAKEWKDKNPQNKDILQSIIEQYKTSSRWHKAVQHLKEKGELDSDPRDIGKLILEVKEDVHQECVDEISKLLFKWAWPHIQRGIVAGLPEWYKDELLKIQFGEED
jgi:hypothetical protein